MRPWLLLGSTGRKSLNQEISGSGMPLAAHSIVAVLVRSTTFSWGPMSMLGKPNGSRSSEAPNKTERNKRETKAAVRIHSTQSKTSSKADCLLCIEVIIQMLRHVPNFDYIHLWLVGRSIVYQCNRNYEKNGSEKNTFSLLDPLMGIREWV